MSSSSNTQSAAATTRYEVRCGNVRMVVQAVGEIRAAIMVVHQAMGRVFRLDDLMPIDNETSSESTSTSIAQAEPLKLDRQVTVRPLDPSNQNTSVANEFSTLEILSKWNAMVATLDRLEMMLGQTV